MRLAREARGVTLREISDQTRISMRYLEAIENNDYKRLPGGIFNRSFVKAYAKYVGFDEKEALEAYARTMREQGDEDEGDLPNYQPHVYTDSGSTRSPFVTLLLMALILAVLSLGAWAALHWYNRRIAEAPNKPATTAPAAQPANPTTNNTPAPQTLKAGLNIQLKAKGARVWIRTQADEESRAETILEPEQTKDLTPQQSVTIEFAKVNAKSLEITINGRAANVPMDSKSNLAKVVITKDNYAQFLQ